MASSEASSGLRNRFDVAASGIGSMKEEEELKPNPTKVLAAGEEQEDDDGWVAVAMSWVRLTTAFTLLMFFSILWAVVMTFFLPWPMVRLKLAGLYGHFNGRMVVKARDFQSDLEMRLVYFNLNNVPVDMWILGNPVKIEGAEYSNTRGIYIPNHASPLDILLIMWLTPMGTSIIAKKEIIWYPLVGQIYFLASHLRIERSDPSKAIESIKEVASTVVKRKLSLCIFPEGTRSKSGRLLPFKKGFVHIALQSRLPIVPMVLIGTHRAWRKGSLRLRPVPLTVKFLPPIITDEWAANKVDDHVKMVHDKYVEHLPESQRPLKSKE